MNVFIFGTMKIEDSQQAFKSIKTCVCNPQQSDTKMNPDSKTDNQGIIKAQIDFDPLRAGDHVKYILHDLNCD